MWSLPKFVKKMYNSGNDCFFWKRFSFFFDCSLTHILTHNRKNGGGDNGHKTAGRNRNPRRKGRKAPDMPG